MTEMSNWWGVILICDLRFSKEQLFYWYLSVGVETKHPPSSAKLLGTSSPYHLHLKLMFSKQFLSLLWYANLQNLGDHVGKIITPLIWLLYTISRSFFGWFGAFIATTLWFSTCPTVKGTVWRCENSSAVNFRSVTMSWCAALWPLLMDIWHEGLLPDRGLSFSSALGKFQSFGWFWASLMLKDMWVGS